MPTNDERREVADGLRRQVKRLGPQMDAHEFAHYGADVIDSDNEILRWDQMMLRLADLIEPDERTCRVVTEMRALSQTQDMHTKSCSSCGYVFGSEQHRQLLPGLGERVAIKPVRIPKFCPNCGARVVPDE
jgi:hypothetical protein